MHAKEITAKRIIRKMNKKNIAKYCPEGISFFEKQVLISICSIEGYFRPFLFRVGEYFFVFLLGLYSAVFKRQMRNYTIGISQIGVTSVLNSYGYSYYEHEKDIHLTCVKQVFLMLSACNPRTSINITLQKISPQIDRAKRIYPNDWRQQVRWIGEVYNGRYSYGLLLEDVFEMLLQQT